MTLQPIAKAYLDLMEKALAGVITEDPPIVNEGHRRLFGHLATSLGAKTMPAEEEVEKFNYSWRERGWDRPQHSLSMIGLLRLRNFRDLVGRAIEEGVPGDIMEAGAWRGGASILARATLNAWGDQTRRLFVADSFEGLPAPSGRFDQDADSTLHLSHDLAVSLETVKANFAKLDLLDERVIFLKGWFKDTMPTAPVSQLAVLRLDGDMYESTHDVLTHMFDKVSPGGWLIVDDYFLDSCRAAVSDFLGSRGLAPKIEPIDEMGVYFRKP